MRFKDVFSIIGPAMIGPSSSHTAGAARIGRAARQILGATPEQAVIKFYGSFAATYKGHGTDTAVVGGLLGFATDDLRIPDALALAEEHDMRVIFEPGIGLFPHPNTVRLIIETTGGSRKLTLVGTSIGGGNIEIVELNGFSVRFSCMYPTLVISHEDRPGVISDLTNVLKLEGMNIGHMSLDRVERQGDALAVFELDNSVSDRLMESISRIPFVQRVDKIDLAAVEGNP